MVVICIFGSCEHDVPSFFQQYYGARLISFEQKPLEPHLDRIASMIDLGFNTIVVYNIQSMTQIRALRFFFSSIVFDISEGEERSKIKPDYVIGVL